MSSNFDLAEVVKLSEEKKYKELAKKLSHFSKLIDQNAEKIHNQIKTLSTKTHTLLFLHIYTNFKVDQNTFLLFDRFLKQADAEQLAYNLKKYVALAKNIFDFLNTNKMTIKIVRALQVSLYNLNKVHAGLTPIHPLFLKVCIDNRLYRQALVIIRQPILNIQKNSDVTEIDLYSYFYYSGEILSVLKQYKEAENMFQLCYDFHSKQLHEIHVAAYKKILLLQTRKGKLIQEEGQKEGPEKMKKQSKSMIEKILNVSCDAYTSLKSLSEVKNVELFDTYVNNNGKLFQDDGNIGLVLQSRFSTVYYYLKQLKKVYSRFMIPQLWQEIQINPEAIPITQLLFEINKIKPIFYINQKLNCIEFKQKDEIDHEQTILNPLSYKIETLRGLFLEFQKENQEIIIERLKNPQTTYC